MPNMELITSVTVGAGGASTVVLPASGTLPQTYTDLKVVYSARCSDTSNNWNVLIGYFNADSTSANYLSKALYAFSSANGATNANKWFGYLPNASSWFAGAFSNGEFYIPNYSVNGIVKSATIDSVTEGNSATLVPLQLSTTQWTGTAPITSITLSCDVGNFLEGSTFYVYGISKVTSSPKATGGIVSQDATYWYHMFPFTSTFTPTQAITADILVIAGGGGGGYYWGAGGGGGGAGGLLAFTSQSLTTTNYTCTVGAGGAVQIGSPNINSYNGGDSQFGALTLVKGGGGGATPNSGSGSTGGSGGGGGSSSGVLPGGAATSGQGYAGGSGTGVSNAGAGGGGGASSVGVDGTGVTGGNGGAGSSSYSSWGLATFTGQIVGGTAYFAGGGGGGIYQGSGAISGIGGVGGGGNASIAGLANTGGGGGGAYYISSTVNPGTGGSGVIIVRYAK